MQSCAAGSFLETRIAGTHGNAHGFSHVDFAMAQELRWTRKVSRMARTTDKESGMLVLSRKESEQVLIGKDVVVTVSKIHSNRVQLAIQAPTRVRVLRGELEATAKPRTHEESGK
jgi:carbon storage regulator CsrA